jgi:PKD repeat protein
LIKIVDNAGVGVGGDGPITILKTMTDVFGPGATNTAFWRGIAFAPVSNTAPPAAYFAADPTTGAAPLFVTFYFTNTVGAITNVFWDFGDASNPNYMGDPTQTNRMVHNVTHYYAPGTYTVTNIVSGPLGSSAPRVAVNYIVVTNPPAPVANFTIWQTNTLAPSTVVFTNVSFGGYTNQFWDFGDGGTTNITPVPPPAISNSSFAVAYTYPCAGTYTVTLTIRSYSGITQAVGVVTVTGAPCGAPTAALNVSTNSGVAPLQVAFFDNSTGYVTNRFWNFGDGNTTNITVYTSGSFSHTYPTGGVFAASLTVTGNGSGNTTTNITVTAPLTPFQAWQNYYFPGGGAGAAGTADPDGDGISNTNEFLIGFNPTNSSAALRIIGLVRTNNDMRITYLGANGDLNGSLGPKTNVLDFTVGTARGYSNNFVTTGITNVLSGGSGLGTNVTVTDVGGATSVTQRYYRVRVLVP